MVDLVGLVYEWISHLNLAVVRASIPENRYYPPGILGHPAHQEHCELHHSVTIPLNLNMRYPPAHLGIPCTVRGTHRNKEYIVGQFI
jgi:hypothetical protein